MEATDLMARLVKLDKSQSCYFPDTDDCDYEKADEQFEGFIEQLQKSTDSIFTTESGLAIQDATFYRSVLLPIPANHFIEPELRFSHFGNLAAVLLEDKVDKALLNSVMALLPLHGYVYVPNELLAQPYDGVQKNPHIDTWWDRYFDYV
jgi:hypothetical protein